MKDIKTISGNTEQEIWSQLEADLFGDEVLNYAAILKLDGKEVLFYMDIDLGGGFEGGSEFMQFKAPLSIESPFRFAIHDKGFIDVIGKFLGMQDIEIGYDDLDKHLIIKTNDEQKVRSLFTNAELRQVFTTLISFDCGIHNHSNKNHLKQTFMELNINHSINDSAEFRKVFHAFYKLLLEIE